MNDLEKQVKEIRAEINWMKLFNFLLTVAVMLLTAINFIRK